MALLEAAAKEPKFIQKLPNNFGQLLKLLKKLKKQYSLRVCYEAGGCGFAIYRRLSATEIDCIVVAPSLIPTDNKQVKTDRMDAQKLAKYYRANLLTPINVPDATLENDRDLIRFRDSQVNGVKRIKQQILAFLLRKDIKYPDRIVWNTKLEDWLATLEMDDQKERVMLHVYLNHYNYQKRIVSELTEQIEELSQTERYCGMVAILKGFIGIETLTAMTIITHVPDFRSFPGPRQFMAYAGLIPGEHSSGDSKKMRGIIKTGSKLLRKALVSIGHHYYMPDKVGAKVRRKRNNLSSPVLSIMGRADRRCRKKYFALSSRGKHINTVKTAVAREIAGFIWEAMIYYYGGELKEAI